MPLLKPKPVIDAAAPATVATAPAAKPAATETKTVSAPKRHAEPAMTKDDYWRRREERDVQRDKDMAWSGLAQAALASVGLIQLNTTNTLEGFVDLVIKATDLLLQARDKRNS